MNTLVTLLTILMGISCFGGQILFIREFLVIFNGNELSIGIILANWMLLQAAGSFISGTFNTRLRSSLTIYAFTLIIIGILFPGGIIAARSAKIFLHAVPGQELGTGLILFTSLLIMAPLGLFLGGQFPLICRLYQDTRKQSLATATGKSYFREAIGFGLGGLIITYGLIPHTHSLRGAFLIGWINCIAAWVLISAGKKKWITGAGIIALLIAGIIGYIYPADMAQRQSLRRQWNPLNIIESRNSAYGNISVINQREQYTFYYDGVPFMSIPLPDIQFTQNIVTFPLAAAPVPDNIAVIGSGLGGIIDTVLRFPVRRIDYAEIDPLIITLAKRYSAGITTRELSDKRLVIHRQDGRLFLRNTARRFDVIIMNLPPPSTLILNRYYTREFFQLVKQRLTPQGLLCLTLPGTLSYLSNEQIDVNKCVLETLREAFTTIDIIPGNSTLYCAGNSPAIKITPETVEKALTRYQINFPLFTKTYLRDRLDPKLKDWFYDSLKKRKVRRNTDLEPSGVRYGIALWKALFQPETPDGFGKIMLRYILGTLSGLIAVGFITARKQKKHLPATGVLLLVLAGGFTGISCNLILLLCLQTFYGYVYLHIGLLISTFMIGLTIGSRIMTKAMPNKENNLRRLLAIDAVFVMVCLLLHPLIRILHALSQTAISLGWILLPLAAASALCGFFIGFEFPLANKIYLNEQRTPAPGNILYAGDMLGAFCGAITVSVFLIPRFGILTTVLIIAGIKLSILIITSAGVCILRQG